MIELVAFAVGGIQVGIAAQLLVHLAAQEVVHRLLDSLAHDVPAGHFQSAQHADQGHVGTQGETGAVGLSPDRFDPEGIAAGEATHEHVLDHRLDDPGPERRGIDLAHTFDAAGGLQFQKDEIAAAETRRWIADDEDLDAVEFHESLGNDGWKAGSTARQHEVRGLLRHHERGRVGVGRGDRRKHRGVDDAQVGDTVHAQRGVDHRVADPRAHAARAHRVVDRGGACPKVRDQARRRPCA